MSYFDKKKYLTRFYEKKTKNPYSYWQVNGKMYGVWRFLDVNIQPGRGGVDKYNGRGSSLKKDDNTVVSQ